MRITSSKFLVSVADIRHLPDPTLKEVAFLGRSNVGKSALISTLCRKTGLARSGGTPGKTRTLNYFLVNNHFYFVDLPGYGFARLPEQIRASLGNLIEQYLNERKTLALAVQLVDSRHQPTELDMMMVGWLNYYEVPFLVTLTKSDKLPRSKLTLHLQEAGRTFLKFRHCKGVVMFSSVTGEGRAEVLSLVSRYVS